MPTFAEIGKGYAAEVKAALREDEQKELIYVKKAYASERVTPGSLGGTALVTALKKIARNLDALRTNGKELSDEQKEEILRQAGIAFGLEDPNEFVWLTKGASNDAYMQMVSHIGALLQAGGKK